MKKKLFKLRFFFLFVHLSIVSEEVIIIEEKIISVSEWEETSSIYLIDKDKIEKTNPQHPSEILNQAPGVWISRGSGQEHLTAIRSPVLTGPGACGSFLTLENGIPTRPSGFCNVNGLFETNFETSDKVEIIKGPSSARYGANAMHGLINIIPFLGSDKEKGLSFTFGRNNYSSFNSKIKEENLNISTSLVRYSGFRENSGYDQQKLSLQKELNFFNWEALWDSSFTNLNQETAGYIYGLDSYKDKSETKKNQNPEAFRDATSFRSSLRLYNETKTGYKSIAPFLRKSSMQFLQHYLPGTPLEKNSHLSIGVIGLEIKELDSFSLSKGFSLEMSQVNLEQFQKNILTDSSSYNNAVRPQGFHYDYKVELASAALFFGFNNLEIRNNMKAYGDLRIESNRYNYKNKMISGNTKDDGTSCSFGGCYYNRPKDSNNNHFDTSFRLGIENKLDENLAVFSTVSLGFRPPQVNEAYRLQKGQSVSHITSENLIMLEAGLNKSIKDLIVGLNMYIGRKDNSIFRDANNFIVDNGKTKHKGIELLSKLNITESSSLEFNATLQNHEYNFDTETSMKEQINRGNKIDTSPKIMANLIYYSELTNNLDIDIRIQKMGKYFTDAANLHEYKGHTLIHSKFLYKFSRTLYAYLEINNLANKDYAERADYNFYGGDRYFPGREREFLIGFKFSY